MAAFLKGATMGLFGIWVLGLTGWHAWHGTLPHAFTMGAVGFAALIANAASFGLRWAYRAGDANMRSAWVCTRNDVLGNLAVPPRSPWRTWHGDRLAGCDSGRDHGRPRAARSMGRA